MVAATCALVAPILVIGQAKVPRDSSAAKPSQRERARQQYFELQKDAVTRAKLAAEKAKIKAKHNVRMHLAEEEWEVDELADLEPAIEEAMSQVEPALAQAREALENVDWGEIDAAMEEASESLSAIAPFAHIPDIPPIPAIPPIPDIPPMPHIVIGAGLSFGDREYKRNLSDEEQVRLQALAALLNNDEKTALPEIKNLARQHENWAMRAAAVSMLANAESAEAIPLLEEVLNKDADQRVRKAAVRALSCREEPAAREVVKRLLMK
jgi:hypothetical protein